MTGPSSNNLCSNPLHPKRDSGEKTKNHSSRNTDAHTQTAVCCSDLETQLVSLPSPEPPGNEADETTEPTCPVGNEHTSILSLLPRSSFFSISRCVHACVCPRERTPFCRSCDDAVWGVWPASAADHGPRFSPAGHTGRGWVCSPAGQWCWLPPVPIPRSLSPSAPSAFVWSERTGQCFMAIWLQRPPQDSALSICGDADHGALTFSRHSLSSPSTNSLWVWLTAWGERSSSLDWFFFASVCFCLLEHKKRS